MKTRSAVIFLLVILWVAGCADREAEARRSKEEAEAKARAAAAQKEMEALPKTFKSRDYLKKNEPAQKPESASGMPKSNS